MNQVLLSIVSLSIAFFNMNPYQDSVLSGRRFECGIKNYWKKTEYLPIKPQIIDKQDYLVDFDRYQVVINDKSEKIILSDVPFKNYIGNARGEEFELYKLTVNGNDYFIFISQLAAATKAYTLMYQYLVFDKRKRKEISFVTLGTFDKTFFESKKKLGIVKFDFSKFFIEKDIISIDASTYDWDESSMNFGKNQFIDCICK